MACGRAGVHTCMRACGHALACMRARVLQAAGGQQTFALNDVWRLDHFSNARSAVNDCPVFPLPP
jgi:hypothetical protein